MSQRDDESAEEWYRRMVIENRRAEAEVGYHWERLGLHKVIRHGERYPVLDAGYAGALRHARAIELEMLEASVAVALSRELSITFAN